MKILITGGSGQLGWELQKVLSDYELIITDLVKSKVKSPKLKVAVKSPKFIALDITNTDKIHEVFGEEKPDWVIHTAAYTAVDKAEDDVDLAFDVNRDGSRNIAEASKETGAKLIAISTDYVFDGKSDQPYTEDDVPNPTGVYGESKLAGEIQTMLENPEAIILRTAWLYGGVATVSQKSKVPTSPRLRGAGKSQKLTEIKYPDAENGVFKNFPNTMLYLAMQGKELKVVNDQFGCPTYAGDLAKVIKQIIDRNGIEPGIYHAVNSGSTSWFGFAKETIGKLKIINKKEKIQIKNQILVKHCKTKDFPTKAKRPKNTVLSTEKLKKAGIEMPNWKEGLKRFIENS